MLSLIFGLLLIVLIVWLVIGITRTRKNPLDDIAKLAAIEATAPQGSVSRKLLTEELKKRERPGGLWLLLGGIFLIIYLSAHTSGTPTQQTSAPVEPTQQASEPVEPAHPSGMTAQGAQAVAAEEAAGLRWAGVVEIRQSTIGCYDIQDTLNPEKAQQLVDQAERALRLALRKEITFERQWELTKCIRISSEKTSSYSYWRVTSSQSFPELPSGKVATCVTSLIKIGFTPTTKCFWVVADKTNVIWTVKPTSAPDDHTPRVPMICGTAGDCGNSDIVKPDVPVVPQRSLTTVIKSRPACLLEDDYAQLVSMAIAYDSKPSPKAARSAIDFANGHCERLEVGQKVWFEDEAERIIDASHTRKLACVAIALYFATPKDTPPDYKRPKHCYWTDLSALDDKREFSGVRSHCGAHLAAALKHESSPRLLAVNLKERSPNEKY